MVDRRRAACLGFAFFSILLAARAAECDRRQRRSCVSRLPCCSRLSCVVGVGCGNADTYYPVIMCRTGCTETTVWPDRAYPRRRVTVPPVQYTALVGRQDVIRQVQDLGPESLTRLGWMCTVRSERDWECRGAGAHDRIAMVHGQPIDTTINDDESETTFVPYCMWKQVEWHNATLLANDDLPWDPVHYHASLLFGCDLTLGLPQGTPTTGDIVTSETPLPVAVGELVLLAVAFVVATGATIWLTLLGLAWALHLLGRWSPRLAAWERTQYRERPPRLWGFPRPDYPVPRSARRRAAVLHVARAREGMRCAPPHPVAREVRRALVRCRLRVPAHLTGPRCHRRMPRPGRRRLGRDEWHPAPPRPRVAPRAQERLPMPSACLRRGPPRLRPPSSRRPHGEPSPLERSQPCRTVQTTLSTLRHREHVPASRRRGERCGDLRLHRRHRPAIPTRIVPAER